MSRGLRCNDTLPSFIFYLLFLSFMKSSADLFLHYCSVHSCRVTGLKKDIRSSSRDISMSSTVHPNLSYAFRYFTDTHLWDTEEYWECKPSICANNLVNQRKQYVTDLLWKSRWLLIYMLDVPNVRHLSCELCGSGCYSLHILSG